MATKMTKSTIVKNSKTSAPKVSRARASEESIDVQIAQAPFDEIAARAYEHFCARGFQHGHDVEDWLAAETELTHR